MLLRESNGGTLLAIKVLPGSSRDGLREVYDGHLKVSVSAVAEKGKANKAVISYLAKSFGVAKNQLSIESGLTDSRKVVRLEGVSCESILDRLKDLGVPVPPLG